MKLRCLTLVLGLVPAGAGHADVFHVYRGERRPLRVDAERVAVKLHTVATAAKVRGLAAAAGLGLRQAERTGVPGWALLGLEPATAGAADGAARVALLAASPDVEFASPVFVTEDGGWACVTPDILLQLREPSASEASGALDAVAAEIAAATPGFGDLPGGWVLRCRSRDGYAVLALANRLATDARVAWAEPDFQFTGRHAYLPNDPGFSNCWGIRNVGQSGGVTDMDMDGDLAWDTTTGDASIRVLVIDVGVQRDHPDLNVAGGADFTGQTGAGNPVGACDSHGTAVAGCIAAVIDNARGTVGIAPGCPVLSARCFISMGDCSGGWVAQGSWTVYALAWGRMAGARVSSNSNGYGFSMDAIDAAYESTRRGGMVHFAASGNGGPQPLGYPANLPTVNAVAAVQRTGQLASWTNYGPEIEFCAPGVAVYTTDRTGTAGWTPGDYIFADGTSFATPYAAGVAALVVTQDPARTADQVEAFLRLGCKDLGDPGFDPLFSWGLVDADASLSAGHGTVSDAGGAGRRSGATFEPVRPNPFTGRATLRFALAVPGPVELVVYDLRGRRVRRLAGADFTAGVHSASWDGRDDAGRRLPTGVYFARLRTADTDVSHKVLLARAR